ncbi:MAG TPA: toxin-antitoxin system HicB family antitoxin [Mycobacteriales bacterium]|nr:toxin-antitoxin system HicB family antitoxin [Mycobacteriales bacterium]
MSSYSQMLREHLLTAAAPGGESVRAVAEQLTAALEPATQLVLLDALSAAAAEISAVLEEPAIEMRLRGRDPEFVVIAGESVVEPAPEAEENTARITLRLPETVKSRVEQNASTEGVSVNAWLVRAIARALEPATRRTATNTGRRISGYVRG